MLIVRSSTPVTAMRTTRRALLSLSLIAALWSMSQAGRAGGDDAETPRTPGQQALHDAIERVDTLFMTSSDLRLRLLFSTNGLEKRGELYFTHETIPLETLVEQARGSTDPLVLDLLSKRCSLPRCDALEMARRWTVADTQNQLAWIAAAGILKQRGNVDEARQMFIRASQASVWHEHREDFLSLVARSVPATATDVDRAAALYEGLGRVSAAAAFSELPTVGQYCKEQSLREPCRRIIDAMARDGRSLLTMTVLPVYAARAGAPEATIADYRRKSDALRWASTIEAAKDRETYVLDIDTVKASADRLEGLMMTGERTRLEKVLAASHLSEEEAAQRFVATLNQQQLARRAGAFPAP